MLFSSIFFLFTFLPVLLILYFAVPFKYKNYVLLAASLLFYAWGEPIYVFLTLSLKLFSLFLSLAFTIKSSSTLRASGLL